ncbi:MAG: DUF624 domain-containing protein [Lachnospiraceae bacterium]|nr:DUF624 domain-containing protein [Lachnospiraceae bacterium]
MDKIFNLDSPVMRFLSRMADLIWLNILALICCVPIITIGASLTALHYVCLKMVRNEEGYITKSFFSSFKRNFVQATVIWLIMLVMILIFAGDIYILLQGTFPLVLTILVGIVMFLSLIGMTMVFPVLARFDNTVKNTIKNAFLMGIANFPKVILMILMNAVPLVVAYLALIQMTPILVMFGLALPAFGCAALYSKIFKRFEPDEEDTITSDENFTVQVPGGEEAAEGTALTENEISSETSEEVVSEETAPKDEETNE